MSGEAGRLAGIIDHTLLEPDATREDIERLCREAAQFGFASVCIHPSWVTVCHDLLRGTGVKVCTVIGFPTGSHLSDVKAYEARRAVEQGADEVDMVIDIGALRSKDFARVEQDIRGVVQAVGHDTVVKAILETSLLTREEKIVGASLARAAGAGYVKTSTGFAGGATVEDVRLIRETVGSRIGVKASGGIRTREDVEAMVAAGATRIGTSAGVRIVRGEEIAVRSPARAVDSRAFLREKRDALAHRAEDLGAFIAAYARGEIPDYQVSAWLMAAFLNGLDAHETDALTRALLASGSRFDWRDLGRPSADKHSTGGVGDKISLVLAPLVAACGVVVPMVSGRGLGHTGGTLDKLESISGFVTRLSAAAMRAQLEKIGVIMVGQGPELAPADGLLYALRDVTSTVECESFIVSSIVSKKIAAGAEAVIYDVKCGGGAFMKDPLAARRLAERLVEATRALGRTAAALVTDMCQPLGSAVGNALEMRESMDVLRGEGPGEVRSLTLELAALMLERCGAEPDPARALERSTRTLDSGAAWEKFLDLVAAQGGDRSRIEREDGLPRAPVVARVVAPRAGRVAAVDAFALGEVVVAIGGGRRAKDQAVDPRVGLIVHARIGDAVSAGQILAEIHLAAADPKAVADATRCFVIDERGAPPPSLVIERIE